MIDLITKNLRQTATCANCQAAQQCVVLKQTGPAAVVWLVVAAAVCGTV